VAKGRPRKPTALKVLEGSHRPDRDGPPESQVKASGTPQEPPTLTGEALELWRRLVPRLAEMGVAAAVDAALLEMMCWWWGRYVAASKAAESLDPADGKALQVLGVASMASKQFNAVACRFGLTPADRARLRVEPASPPATPVAPRRR
jgi:P27 family predicted phage terminase small subunit